MLQYSNKHDTLDTAELKLHLCSLQYPEKRRKAMRVPYGGLLQLLCHFILKVPVDNT